MPQAPLAGRRESARQTASKALIGAAVVHLLPGLLYWPVAGIKFDANDVVRIGGFVLFVAMGLWARRSPRIPAATCFSLYAALLGLQAYQGTLFNPMLIVVEAPVFVLLLVALVAAFMAPAGKGARKEAPENTGEV